MGDGVFYFILFVKKGKEMNTIADRKLALNT